MFFWTEEDVVPLLFQDHMSYSKFYPESAFNENAQSHNFLWLSYCWPLISGFVSHPFDLHGVGCAECCAGDKFSNKLAPVILAVNVGIARQNMTSIDPIHQHGAAPFFVKNQLSEPAGVWLQLQQRMRKIGV